MLIASLIMNVISIGMCVYLYITRPKQTFTEKEYGQVKQILNLLLWDGTQNGN